MSDFFDLPTKAETFGRAGHPTDEAAAHAINCHDDLVAALEADEAAFAMTIGDGRDHAARASRKMEATVKARQIMRAALAKARGEG